MRRRAPGFFSGARLRAHASAILDALFGLTAGSRFPELSSGDCMGGQVRHTLAEPANARALG